jgi:hypothetical protein
MSDLPEGFKEAGGQVFNASGKLVEKVDGKWLPVRDASRMGWFRYHEHYDRDGYCDNPARGY